MTGAADHVDAIVVGGGPAGSALARLMASWGHRVALLTRTRHPERGQAESIPPSAGKLLQVIGVRDAVSNAGFRANRGNIVWWGSDRARTEDFGDATDSGLLVYRPHFDAVLLDEAERAGATVHRDVAVRSIHLDDGAGVLVIGDRDRERVTFRARFVADASGRTGVLARRGYRRYQSRHRLQAFVGLWRGGDGFSAEVADRTLIETYEDGWAWSLPATAGVRQIAVMVDGTTTGTSRGPTLADSYRAELAKTRHVCALAKGAVLDRAWACDASMYSAGSFAGDRFLLVGDAATCIDPLSSSGVKKALASAWLAAVALHTALADATRRTLAFDFFSAREEEIYAAELARTEAFAQRALARHDHPFWEVRGADPQPPPPEAEIDRLLRGPAVRQAHARLRSTERLSLRWRDALVLARAPRVVGREVVLDDAVAIGASTVRVAAGIDLVALARLAVAHDSVSAVVDGYQRLHGAADLPSLLAALSLLIAERVLE